MNREILAIGNTGAQLVSKFNNNFQKVLLSNNFFNVEDYGAVHNNSTDDTAAIQVAINTCAAAGGGKVCFPKGIYLIAGALQNHIQMNIYSNVHYVDYNSQLYIPAWDYSSKQCTIELVGEFAPNFVDFNGDNNGGVVLRSTIAGSGDWPSVICSMGQTTAGGQFNFNVAVIENIKVVVNPFIASGGPSMCGVNFFWGDHTEVKNLTCSIDLAWLDMATSVMPTNHVFGLMIGSFNNNFPSIKYYMGNGFYYGLIMGEGTHAINVFCWGNYIGLMSINNLYGALIDYHSSHWNVYDIAAWQEAIYGAGPGSSLLRILHMASEDNNGYPAAWNNRVDEILDNSNQLYGEMSYFITGASSVTDGEIVKSHGGYNFLTRNTRKAQSSFSWTTTGRPTNPWPGCSGYNETTNKMECWNGSTWNDLW